MSDPRTALPVAAWYPDPTDASSLRWWDGRAWTPHVTTRGSSASQQPYSGVSSVYAQQPAPQAPVFDDSRALPSLATAASAPAPLPTGVPTSAPSYDPAYVPTGGYQAAYLSAHPEADLSPRPGAYQQPVPVVPPTGQAVYPGAPASVRPETEPIDYPSVIAGLQQAAAAAGAGDPGPMAASLHANRTGPTTIPAGAAPQGVLPPGVAPGTPMAGQLASYPPPSMPQQASPQAPAPYAPPQQPSLQNSAAAQSAAALLNQAPPPSIAALLGGTGPQPTAPQAPPPAAAPAAPLALPQQALPPAPPQQVQPQQAPAPQAPPQQAAQPQTQPQPTQPQASAPVAPTASAVPLSSIPGTGETIRPQNQAQPGEGGYTEGYQAGFRAALEGKAQIAAADKRTREVDPNAEPVALAGLDPANQNRSRGRALDPSTDNLAAPMHRGGA